MYDFMAWLEASTLGHVMRESGVWTYGCVNLVHILGVATLFGSVVILDLRLLGLWRNIALVAISKPTVRHFFIERVERLERLEPLERFMKFSSTARFPS